MTDPACTWPHALMTAEDERALESAIAPHRPFIEAAARILSKHDPAMAADLVQEALVLLWSWGCPRVLNTETRAVRGAIVNVMLVTRRAEWEARGGSRRLRVHLAPGRRS